MNTIRNKKGFTIIELVVVIAVVAILAAVLIPTFASLIHKANISFDLQLVRNLNNALAIEKAEHGRHHTMHDALHTAKQYGYDLVAIQKTSGDIHIVWDSVNDLFCYYDGSVISYVPDEANLSNTPSDEEKYKYFAIYDTVPATADQTFSVYYSGTDGNDAAKEVEVGFDAGHSYVNVTYSGDKEVTIRVFGGSLTVSRGKATVYGFVGKLAAVGDGVTAAKGTVFHEGEETIALNFYGKFTDNGAEYEKHFFGEDDIELHCVVSGCDATNPDHICVYGEPVYEQNDNMVKATYTCTICNKTKTSEFEGTYIQPTNPACDHSWQTKSELPATCTTPGMTVQECSKCHALQSLQQTPALGHDWKVDSTESATCTAPAVDHMKCGRDGCDATKDVEKSPALGHDYAAVPEKPATCTDGGYSAHDKCKRCEFETFYTQYNATGHDWDYKKENGKYIAVCKNDDAHNITTEAQIHDTYKRTLDLNEILSKASEKNATMHDAFTCIVQNSNNDVYKDITAVINEIKSAEEKTSVQTDDGRVKGTILWDQTIDRFVVAECTENGALSYVTILYTPDDSGVTGKKNNSEFYKLWDTVDRIDITNSTLPTQFSIYLEPGAKIIHANNSMSISINCGFDMGDFDPQNYTKSDGSKDTTVSQLRIAATNAFNGDYIIRTVDTSSSNYEVYLSVGFTGVSHYGYLFKLEMPESATNITYHEYGEVKGFGTVTSGTTFYFHAEQGSKIGITKEALKNLGYTVMENGGTFATQN